MKLTFLETRRAFNNGRMFTINGKSVTMFGQDHVMCGSLTILPEDAVFVETPPSPATHIGMNGYYHWNGRAVLKYKPRSNSWSHTSWHKEELDNAEHFSPLSRVCDDQRAVDPDLPPPQRSEPFALCRRS